MTICYEYIAKVDQIAPRNQPAGGLPRETMIVGAFVQAVLHEVAVATFDILEIPVWGRETDAADKLAGFIMVQFGKDVALKVMIGAAWFFDASERHLERIRFRQRAVAGSAALLQLSLHRVRLRSGIVQVPDRPEPAAGPPRRSAAPTSSTHCALPSPRTILPHVDQQLLKRVQSATWLMLDEPK